MTIEIKTIEQLAKQYNAEIVGQNCDEIGTGILEKTYSVDEYYDRAHIDIELGKWIDSSDGEVICDIDCRIESTITYKKGLPVSATYCSANGYTAGNEIEDDINGVISLWES